MIYKWKLVKVIRDHHVHWITVKVPVTITYPVPTAGCSSLNPTASA